jgi:putative endonuclease
MYSQLRTRVSKAERIRSYSSESLSGIRRANTVRMRGIGARFVYVLRSETDPSRHYVGRASNVEERIDWHNAGPTGYTVQHRPWRVIVSIEFPDESMAARFEKYLKSGSGRAFAKRHFAPATQPSVDSSE